MLKGFASLPPASILEKLKSLDPAAPEWIMKRAEELQRAEHTKPIAKSPLAWKAFVQGVRDAFNFGLSAPCPPSAIAPADALGHSWIVVGDYMRMAMRDYIAQHGAQCGLDASMPGFSAEEKRALSLVFLKDGNYPPLEP